MENQIMKKYVMALLMIAAVTISASVVNRTTPATPAKVFVKKYQTASDAIEDIKYLSAKGYITKSFVVTNYGSYGTMENAYLIMEKY